MKTYLQRQEIAQKKEMRLEKGTLNTVIELAKAKFKIEGDFTVSKQTIHNRKKAKNLEVWYPGISSPLLLVEVVLRTYIIVAWQLNNPLSVTNTKALMNSLIENSKYEREMIAFKMKCEIYDADCNVPVVGNRWWATFQIRNPDVKCKTGRKYPRNRPSHCNTKTFTKMFDQIADAAVKSGNAVALVKPVHMNLQGEIVSDEVLAFGRPVSLEWTRLSNVFYCDETGDNTHGKEDAIKGGEKQVVPAGEIPQEVVGIHDAHYTILPINNLLGELVFVTVIFKGEKLNPL